MDVKSWEHWRDYIAAYQWKLEEIDPAAASWYYVDADNKRRARLNGISHLLGQFQYSKMDWDPHGRRLQPYREPYPSSPSGGQPLRRCKSC